MAYLYKFEAMNTPCELLLFEPSKHKADKIAQEVLQETKRLEQKYNYFTPHSYLSALNKRDETKLDMETKTLLQRALGYYNATSHIFDVTIGTIKDLYKSAKSLEELQQKKALMLPYIGCEHFTIKRNKLYFDNPYTKIDLGGFVKEYAVDRAVSIFKKRKIKAGLVNFGGDIFALGKKPDGSPFKIGIKDPHNPHRFHTFVEIENEALTTSASYERNYQIEDENFSHIIPKKAHTPSPNSVTVISQNCVESGVYSTSLMVNPNIKIRHKTLIL